MGLNVKFFNRRKRSRFPTEGVRLKGHIMPLSSNSYAQAVWVLDISSSGIRIASSMSLTPGFEMLVHIPHDGKVHEFVAKVAWSRIEQGNWISGIEANDGIEELERLFQQIISYDDQNEQLQKVAQ